MNTIGRRSLPFAIFAMTLLGSRPAIADSFTLDQILSAPYPTDLIAAPDGGRFAWVNDAAGVRNVWLASPVPGAARYDSRQITHYSLDDGLEIADLAFIPHGGLLFVRGGDFETPDKPPPNPAHLSAGVEQQIFLAGPAAAPFKLADGRAPLASPSGDRVIFIRKGEVWTISPQRDAKAAQLFKTRGEVDSLRFSPDGAKLAFVANRGDHSFVGIYSFSDRILRWLDASLGHDLEPRWSPDGRRIAFLRLPSTHAEVGIGPHRTGAPWSIRVAAVEDGRTIEAYRAPQGAGSVFHALGSEAQLFWTAGDRLVFPAENDGWLHFYSVPATGGNALLLTPGDFEIEYAAGSPDGASIVYASNAGDIDRRHLWRIRFPGGPPEALTAGAGIETQPVVASDSAAIAFLCADARVPMHAALLEAGKPCRDLGHHSVPADFPLSALTLPQSVLLPERASVAAHGILFLPPADAGGQPHPALIFMHGGPVRQMLLGWHYMDYYSNAYAFNQYMASRGYVVLALNYRSGIGYGLNFREAEHSGATGASEYNDLLAAADYLHGRPDVDQTRIGLWGGSYGGYMTALGLSHNSNLFAVGIDLHGVHDWHNWSVATARGGQPFYALDAPPHTLATALAASPISAVSQWRSPVLLIQGDDDRNVDFSESVRLAEALRAAGVEYSELIFPDEIHDFLRHETWLKAYTASARFLDGKLSH